MWVIEFVLFPLKHLKYSPVLWNHLNFCWADQYLWISCVHVITWPHQYIGNIYFLHLFSLLKEFMNSNTLIPIKLTTCISILYKNVSCKIYWSQVWNNMNNMQYFELIHFQIYFMVLKYHIQHPLWPVPIQIRVASWEF